MSTDGEARRLRVMQSYTALRDTTNPYLKQLHSSLEDHVDVRLFSWRDALLGRFDVLHLHWPEVLLRSGIPLRQWLRRAALMGVLVRIRLSRRALVRTVHNPEPHEPGSRFETALLSLVDRWTTLFVLLVPDTLVPVDGGPSTVIPHGDYRQWFAEVRVPPIEPGRLAYVGLLRRYKGVEELLDVFARTSGDHPSWKLRIIGRSQDVTLTQTVAIAVAKDQRVTARLEYVSDHDLADEVGRAELVVLPYREMHNSGSALLALSLRRPILVPHNAVTAALSTETGSTWVQTYQPPLTADVLADAVRCVPDGAREPGPNLADRAWPVIAEAHAAAYYRAQALRRRPRGTVATNQRPRPTTDDTSARTSRRSDRRIP